MATDRRFKKDLNSLQEKQPPVAPRRQNRSRDPIPQIRGIGKRSLLGSSDAGTIQSPLTEEDFDTREYYGTEAVIAISSDGLFTLEAPAIKTIIMTDAGNNEIEFVYADPEA
jgi:hypothetical protein